MTAHCANPACAKRFQYFRSGKVFLIDYKSSCMPRKRPRDIEYFWLCGDCSLNMRVSVNAEGNIVLEDLASSGPTAKKIVTTASVGITSKKLLTA